MRNEDFALPNAPEHLINCEDLDPLLEKIATRHFNQSMDLVKTTIWGEEDHHWEFRCIGEPTNDVGDAYEGFLNGVSQGVKLLVTWQKMLLSNYNPFSI